MEQESIQNKPFVVGVDARTASAWCVWEWDLRERNLRFLDKIDPDYYRYVLNVHLDHLDGEHAHRAAVAIRLAYHHALETLFTLLCAAVQAPDCVVAYVPKCGTGQLRALVGAITRGYAPVPNKLRLERVSWRGIAECVFACSHPEEEERNKNVDRFAGLWARLAHAFLDEKGIAEYNSMKHGFRVRSGGFTLRAGREEEYGKGAPPEAMKTIGHSDFGSSFFVPEQVRGSPDPEKRDIHFRVREHALNWLPDAVAGATYLAAMSIHNVVSFLKVANGVEPNQAQFERPQDPDAFEKPWSSSTGVTSMTMDNEVSEAHIARASREDILRVLGLLPEVEGD